jgi:hypothetical protein
MITATDVRIATVRMLHEALAQNRETGLPIGEIYLMETAIERIEDGQGRVQLQYRKSVYAQITRVTYYLGVELDEGDLGSFWGASSGTIRVLVANERYDAAVRALLARFVDPFVELVELVELVEID